MKMLAFQEEYLKIYSAEEVPLLDGTKYIIQQVESKQTEKVTELLKQGFKFHERYLFVEANLKASTKMRAQINDSLKGLLLEMNRSYTEDIYELAYESFETDRRFHLEQQFDQDRAKYVKESYINWCRDSGMLVFSARREDELLGYVIIEPHSNRELGEAVRKLPSVKIESQKAGSMKSKSGEVGLNMGTELNVKRDDRTGQKSKMPKEDDITGSSGAFQIILGVTRPGIKGKIAALMLYNGLLNRLSLLENGGYTRYCGYISSTNVASINLHQCLGAKVVGVMDEYIYRSIGGK